MKKVRALTMRILVRSLVFAGLLAGLAAAGSPETVKGVLIDKQCSSKAEPRIVPGPRIEGGMIVAEAHTRECLLMPACQKSGYGVFTYENKFLAFDEAGNRKALEVIKSTKKEDDVEVEVTGEIQGDTIKVTSIKLL